MVDAPQIAVLHISLCCTDFSTMKGGNLRRQAVQDLTSSRDLTYDGLRCVETLQPAVVVIEQVANYKNAPEHMMLVTKLRRWGYEVSEAVLRASEAGGKTGRDRYYLVASVYPGFAMPVRIGERVNPMWPDLEPFFAGCRDVTHTKSVAAGLETGRIRLIKPESIVAPTLTRSQGRQAKDSIYIAMPDGRYLLPSEDLLRHLSGIPDDFSFANVAHEQVLEQIGQGIDVPMHAAVCRAVHQHLVENVGRHTMVAIGKSVPTSSLAPTA